MAYDFNFEYIRHGGPVVTLSSLGISFNRGAIDALGNPDQVLLGYDEKYRAIGVRARGDDTTSPFYEFGSRVKNDWVRIGAKDFARYLAKVSGIDFLTKAKQFIPEYDEETQTLVIVVDEDHLK